MTTLAPFFPRIVSDTRGRREAANVYVFATISLPSKKERSLATKMLFFLNSCAIKCVFQLTKFTDLSCLDTLIIYNLKVYFLYLKTKVTAFNFL